MGQVDDQRGVTLAQQAHDVGRVSEACLLASGHVHCAQPAEPAARPGSRRPVPAGAAAGSYGGLVADRAGKRRLLLGTQSALGLLAFQPGRQTFVPEMVGRDRVQNAVSLNSVLTNASRAVGPAAAGVLIATAGIGHPTKFAGAEMLLLLTDVSAVIDGYGTSQARPIRHATPTQLRARSFPAGSMGSKVEAASFRRPAGRPPSAASTMPRHSSTAQPERSSWPAPGRDPISVNSDETGIAWAAKATARSALLAAVVELAAAQGGA